jgi:hypothetical protein
MGLRHPLASHSTSLDELELFRWREEEGGLSFTMHHKIPFILGVLMSECAYLLSKRQQNQIHYAAFF